MSITRSQVIEVAKSYLKTPFVHQGRTRGVGLDCAGFIVVTCQDLGLPIIDEFGYSRLPSNGLLERVCDSQSIAYKVSITQIEPADILLMKFINQPQHLAIYTGNSIIHSWEQPGMVCEHSLNDLWRSRIVGAYRLQGITS